MEKYINTEAIKSNMNNKDFETEVISLRNSETHGKSVQISVTFLTATRFFLKISINAIIAKKINCRASIETQKIIPSKKLLIFA